MTPQARIPKDRLRRHQESAGRVPLRAQIVFEAMLEDVNNVLNTCEPRSAGGRRDHHSSLQADAAEAAAADEAEYFRLLFGARHGELHLILCFSHWAAEIGCACSRQLQHDRRFAEWRARRCTASRTGCSRRRIWSSVKKFHLESTQRLSLSMGRS